MEKSLACRDNFLTLQSYWYKIKKNIYGIFTRYKIGKFQML